MIKIIEYHVKWWFYWLKGGENMECSYCGSMELIEVACNVHKCITCGEIVYNDELFEDNDIN